MKSPFSYKVVYYDCLSNNYQLEGGMGIAESFSDAMETIERRYGTDLVLVKEIYLYEENEVILLPLDFIDKYKIENKDYNIPCDEWGNEV